MLLLGREEKTIPFPNMPLSSLAQPCAAHTESTSEWKGLWCQVDLSSNPASDPFWQVT